MRKFLYFQKRLSKLGPGFFSCNERQSSCTRTSAKPRRGCPDCEFTIQTKIFHKELDEELKKLKGTREGQRKWNRKVLLDTVLEIMSLAGTSKVTKPEWPVNVANMVSIYREESGKMKAIDNFNMSAGYGDSPSSPMPDENEEDFD